ncbi:P-loop containing nucleoside triphosphate hydrolase protein, partial [Suillus bovinus]|uniref:P-loop containing nucleoside triphosphate hydrolase protein n=1 Tax=Suillus bovinus TaxID=48563 RepID=UPI001B87056B
TFRRVYEVPILKSRAPDCTAKELELGEARSAQLSLIAKSFVLRREASILKNYLPPKHEYVVFITPTQLQLSIFSAILNPDKLDRLIDGPTAESLALINILTKVSNSPVLLKTQTDKARATNTDAIRRPGVDDALSLLPKDVRVEDVSMSGKLLALSHILKAIKERTQEKCIIVSHYTSTLNLIEAFCKKKSYTYFRLDGQTPAAKRQEYVNTFNKSSQYSHFLFLLSSKAGGVGLNLIGASRLCLIDSDWNPSHDLQSMARIHRDGQKRPVFIYRFLTAGTIDEKIYQRQVTKIGLSNSLMGSGSSGSKSDSFSRKDLRDIFRVHPETGCNTHDLLDCGCDAGSKQFSDNTTSTSRSDIEVGEDDDDEDSAGTGFVNASQVKPRHIEKMDGAYMKKKQAELASLGEWTHINCLRRLTSDNIHDAILRHLVLPSVSDDNDPLAQPKSRLDSLLSAVDLDNIMVMDEVTQPLSVRDVPGGTISFLFEKTSVSTLEENNVEEDSTV